MYDEQWFSKMSRSLVIYLQHTVIGWIRVEETFKYFEGQSKKQGVKTMVIWGSVIN